MINILARENAPKTTNTEQYSVYAYYPNRYSSTMPKWKRISATRNMKRAVKYAKLLSRRNHYEKIEVKKRFFCERQKKFIGQTVYSDEPNLFSWRELVDAFTDKANNA